LNIFLHRTTLKYLFNVGKYVQDLTCFIGTTQPKLIRVTFDPSHKRIRLAKCITWSYSVLS